MNEPDRLVAITAVVLDAARVLASNPPPERLSWIAATDPLPRVRHHALASLLRRDGPGDWLRPYAADPDGRVAVVAASALGEAGRYVLIGLLDVESVCRSAVALSRLEPGTERPKVERVLLSCVSAGDTEVIDALGRVGTALTVPVLAPIAHRRLGLGAVAREAKGAIRTIQARIGAGTEGALALADSPEGGLSVSERTDDRDRS